MNTLDKLFDSGWNSLSSNRLIRQLDISYNRFYRHTLFRYWSQLDYQTRSARWAEQLPPRIGEWFTLLLIGLPIAALLLQLFFGTSVVNVVGVVFGIGTFMLALALSISGMTIATMMASMAVAQERISGRWELLMILPRDRSSILLMRLSSILYPYRALIVTLDVLQSIAAILSVAFVSFYTDVQADLISLCILYLLPCMVLLSWERRQDYVISLIVGAYTALNFNERRAFTLAIAGVFTVVAVRVIMTVLPFGLAGTAASLTVLIPAVIGGPALLPMIGVPFWVSLGFIVIYYLLREVILSILWRVTVLRMDELNF